MQSLAEECTPLKQRYDACFNLWFEGYLQPALDAAGVRRPLMSGVSEETSASAPSSSTSTSAPSSAAAASPEQPKKDRRRLITSWAYSTAFRRRAMATPAAPDDMVGAKHVHYDMEPEEDEEQIDTTGMTRAQIKAAQYERQCGRVWKEYQACLRKNIAENENLTQLLEQAREEHPLHRMDGLEGTAWDPSNRGD